MSALALSDHQQQARERARQGIRGRDRSQLEIGHDLLVAFPLSSRGHATGWSAFCTEVEAEFDVRAETLDEWRRVAAAFPSTRGNVAEATFPYNVYRVARTLAMRADCSPEELLARVREKTPQVSAAAVRDYARAVERPSLILVPSPAPSPPEPPSVTRMDAPPRPTAALAEFAAEPPPGMSASSAVDDLLPHAPVRGDVLSLEELMAEAEPAPEAPVTAAGPARPSAPAVTIGPFNFPREETDRVAALLDMALRVAAGGLDQTRPAFGEIKQSVARLNGLFELTPVEFPVVGEVPAADAVRALVLIAAFKGDDVNQPLAEAGHPLAVARWTVASACWYRQASRAWLKNHDLPPGPGRTKAAVTAWLQAQLDEVKKAS